MDKINDSKLKDKEVICVLFYNAIISKKPFSKRKKKSSKKLDNTKSTNKTNKQNKTNKEKKKLKCHQ